MHKYTNEIKTVIVNDIVVGYITRRWVLFGIAQNIPNDWYATRSIIKPDWQGGFATRREARGYLFEKLVK